MTPDMEKFMVSLADILTNHCMHAVESKLMGETANIVFNVVLSAHVSSMINCMNNVASSVDLESEMAVNVFTAKMLAFLQDQAHFKMKILGDKQ